LAISKQMRMGGSIIEPYWSARASVNNVVSVPILRHLGTTLGVVLWLGAGKQGE